MVGALAELISYQIDDAVKKLQSVSKTKISPGAISSLYVLLGCVLLIVIPSYIFTKVEGKNITYFQCRSFVCYGMYRMWNKTVSVTNETTFYVGVFHTLEPSYWLFLLKLGLKFHPSTNQDAPKYKKHLRKKSCKRESFVSDTVQSLPPNCYGLRFFVKFLKTYG